MPVDGRTLRAEERRKERRSQLLAAATQVIAERGYAHTSVDDVIKAAGVSRGTFYLYFESRDALFAEMLDEFLMKLGQTVEIISLDDVDPAGALYQNFKRVIELLATHRNLTKVLFREAVGLSEAIDQRVNGFYDFLYAMVIGALRKGVLHGIIREVDESTIAPAIVGTVKEVIRARIVAGSEEVDADELTGAIFDFGLNGLRAV
ncbi:MAG: AcrR family transcriptional regulator [Bradymonadia bacterium]|jgi:AcrR family transcriptional regulator